MTLLLLLASVSSATVPLTSDGGGFLALPDSLWPAPGPVMAVYGGDTSMVAPGFNGSLVGLRLDPPPARGETVLVVMETLPLTLPNRRSLDLRAMERLSGAPEGSAGPAPPEGQGLYISGAKRLGVSVGRGGGVSQATRISVDGMIARDIEVTGSVTDENLPIGAGSSELVSELDRVLFRVRGPRWRARLGDLEWERSSDVPGPTSYRREASGLDGLVEGEGWSAEGGWGTSGQSLRRSVFFTEEGLQGPYEFSGGVEVVPGSETVLLDGESLQRGVTADYTVDYAAGLLTFNPSRMLREDQRVEVSYYGRGDGFASVLARGDGALQRGGLRLELSGLRDADDRDDPLGFVLSEEAEERLRSIGEDPDSAWIDGAEKVGEGEGDYDLDSLGHYVYAGPDGGSWDVAFSRPPEGPGDYVYDSSAGGFVWVGAGEGTHLPRRYLQLPASLEVGGAALNLAGEGSGPRLDIEAALSERVGNLFNPAATTTRGSAVKGRTSTPVVDDLRAGLRGMVASSGFTPAGVLESDSSLASWALPPGYGGRDSWGEAWLGGGRALLAAGARAMESGGSAVRVRSRATPLDGQVRVELDGGTLRRSDTDSLAPGSRGGLSALATLGLGPLRPSVGAAVRTEDWRDSLSGDRITGSMGLLFERSGQRGNLGLEMERDLRTGGPPRPDRRFRAFAEGSNRMGRWRLQSHLEHSLSLYREQGSSRANAVSLNLTGSGGGTFMQAIYDGSNVVSRSLEVRYRYVGDGEGDYSWDPETGEYYPDPDGDYQRYYQPGGEGEVVTEATLDVSASRTMSGWGADGSLRLESTGDRGGLEPLLLSGAFSDETDGGYTLTLSPWWRLEGAFSRLSLYGRASRSTESYSGTGRRLESELRGRAQPRFEPGPGWYADLTAEAWRSRQELYEPRRVTGLRAAVDPVATFPGWIEPGLELSGERRVEEVGDLEAWSWAAAPHFSLSGGGYTGSGRLEVWVIPGSGELPPWFFDGSDRGTGLSANLRAGRRLAGGLDLALTYWARRPAGGDVSQRAGLEGTVSF
jgi:hypothetical protein